MKFRSLFLLGVGAAIACATPAFAAGTAAAAHKTEVVAAATQSVAALDAATSKADPAKVKKPKAKSVSKKKKKPAVEEVTEEKPHGLFAALFGGGIKQTSSKDGSQAKAKLATAAAKA